MNFQSILTVINIIVMGAAGYGFVANKTAEAKFDPAPLVRDLAETKTEVAVQKTEVTTIKSDIKEMKADIKEIKDLFYQELGYNKPAVTPPTNAPFIVGTQKDGSPKNE